MNDLISLPYFRYIQAHYQDYLNLFLVSFIILNFHFHFILLLITIIAIINFHFNLNFSDVDDDDVKYEFIILHHLIIFTIITFTVYFIITIKQSVYFITFSNIFTIHLFMPLTPTFTILIFYFIL